MFTTHKVKLKFTSTEAVQCSINYNQHEKQDLTYTDPTDFMNVLVCVKSGKTVYRSIPSLRCFRALGSHEPFLPAYTLARILDAENSQKTDDRQVMSRVYLLVLLP